MIGGWRTNDDDRREAFVARVDPDGHPRFSATFRHEEGDALVSGVALDGAGRIAVAGAVFSEAEDWDRLVALYQPDGELSWSQVVAGDAGGEDQAVGIAVGGDGEELFAVGYEMQADGTTDAWMRRLGPDGATRWDGRYAGAFGGIDVATDVAFDPVGGTFLVVGYETVGPDDTDVLAMAIEKDGTPRWRMLSDEAGGADRGQGIAPDGTGGAWVVGHAVVPGRTVDAWLGRVDPAGVLAFRVLHDGPVSLGDGAADVAAVPDGTAIVGGHEFGTAGKWDGWIVKLDGDGATIWTHVYAGPAAGDDIVAGVAVDPLTGDVYAVGSTATVGGGASGAGDSRREIWLRKLAG